MSKYKNIKTVVDGYQFDSKKESERYKVLCRFLQSGSIKDLELQKRFVVFDAQTFEDTSYNEKAITYVADFYYYDKYRRRYVVEDVKGSRKALRPEYVIKRKLFKKRYPDIQFVEII